MLGTRGEEITNCKSHIAPVSLTDCCIMIFFNLKNIHITTNKHEYSKFHQHLFNSASVVSNVIKTLCCTTDKVHLIGVKDIKYYVAL